MANKVLLKIAVGEFEKSKNKKLLYTDLVELLWGQGFSGVTVLRVDEGIDETNSWRVHLLEDTPFNNLPIIIETFEREDKIVSITSELKQMIPHGEITTTLAYEIFKEALPVKSDHFMLKIYLKEKSKGFGLSLYEEVFKILHEQGMIWSTVTRGIEGYGTDHVIHKKSIFSLSAQVPILIESVGTREDVEKILPELQKRIHEGLVIAIPVNVILNR